MATNSMPRWGFRPAKFSGAEVGRPAAVHQLIFLVLEEPNRMGLEALPSEPSSSTSKRKETACDGRVTRRIALWTSTYDADAVLDKPVADQHDGDTISCILRYHG